MKKLLPTDDNVLKINQTDVDALYNKGLALDNLGRYQESVLPILIKC